ncbi:MAG TPA: hydroxylamine reductase [Myxococcota bacterium]|nr:hydroxylamine reductase [Myxococcota bacterium]HRY95052.1 hydroxylamine reductase [Myxococcota bacterium]HSA20481.1 hydroxylamine reductase [Myxococcota bacterium]
MFCYQCEQTAKGSGCTKAGVCGKDGTSADLQDVLTHLAKGVAMLAHRARQLGGVRDPAVDRFVVEALFTTVTNVNFDAQRLEGLIRRGVEVRARARGLYEAACQQAGRAPEALSGPVDFQPAGDRQGLAAQAPALGIQARRERLGDDRAGVLELALYGLKGAAAYVDHALVLGQEDEGLYAFFHAALDLLASEPELGELVGLSLEVGAHNLKAMELLDRANTGTYGHPEPTSVRVSAVEGKAILVSGHDLRDLELLLQQTQGQGVNIYTHGEMLPALAYPGLKKYPHLVGNYGGAWQDQQKEFEAFPGAVLMTTNCIQRPRDSYKGRIFTTGLVAFPGVAHVADKDFGPVIRAAREAPGFAADEPERRILVGFARQAVLGVAGQVVEAVRAGKIRHFFLVGGCDGAKPGRNYYTEFAQQAPADTLILTLACGKYRFNKLEFGDIGGIPRLLDVGQCNDAYSAIQIALALAQAFQTDVNSLPLSLVLSWYEQKAVAILLTLLHLGIRNIRLGPSLPAFVTPAVLGVLVEKFGIAPVTTPEADLKALLKTA